MQKILKNGNSSPLKTDPADRLDGVTNENEVKKWN